MEDKSDEIDVIIEAIDAYKEAEQKETQTESETTKTGE